MQTFIFKGGGGWSSDYSGGYGGGYSSGGSGGPVRGSGYAQRGAGPYGGMAKFK